MTSTWTCHAWIGNTCEPSHLSAMSTHRFHAEINLLRRIQLKGI